MCSSCRTSRHPPTLAHRFTAVNATDIAYAEAESTPGFRFDHWTAVRRGALVIYFASLVAWSAHYGIPAQRELVIAWVCGALACASLGRHPRQMLQLVVDWLPIVVILGAYDLTRGTADSLGIGVHVGTMIDFDRSLFFGTTPDRVAAGPRQRPDRCQRLGRRLHPHLHLVLHRPVRGRRRSLDPGPARVRGLRETRRDACARRRHHLHPLPRRAAVDGGGHGADRRRAPDHRRRLANPRRPDRRAVQRGSGERQHGRRRALASLGVHGAGGDVPLVSPPAVPAAAARPLSAGDGVHADGDRGALLLRCAAGMAVRRERDGGLGMVGAAA